MTSDCALGRLQEQWARTNAGWSIDPPSGPLLIHLRSSQSQNSASLVRSISPKLIALRLTSQSASLTSGTFTNSSPRGRDGCCCSCHCVAGTCETIWRVFESDQNWDKTLKRQFLSNSVWPKSVKQEWPKSVTAVMLEQKKICFNEKRKIAYKHHLNSTRRHEKQNRSHRWEKENRERFAHWTVLPPTSL